MTTHMSTKRSSALPGVLGRFRAAARGDDGVALMTVILAGAVLTALAMVAATVSLNNLRNAGRDRVAGGALGAAEAGLAEAVSYLSTATAYELVCSPNCVGNPWGNASTPQTIVSPDGNQWRSSSA